MKKTGWLSALLIVSWTLNVALIVAYFMKTTYPPGVQFSAGPDIDRFHGSLPGIPSERRAMFQMETSPLHNRYVRLIGEMSDNLAGADLDTSRIMELSDSLTAVRGELQRKLVEHLVRVHGDLSPEGRFRLSRRLFSIIEGKRPGMGTPNQFRGGRRFRSDSTKRPK
ncbi:MAG TPA: hypothetical protein ENL08_05300 [Bacteroidetes bacterium]|nr:hypothetical protein [Bacteroidota bacterium]